MQKKYEESRDKQKFDEKHSVNQGEKSMENFDFIGEGNRWYDYAYNFLRWLYSGKRKDFIPKFIKNIIHIAINYLLQLNIHDEHKHRDFEDPMYNLHVPKDENVNIPAIWAIELFPPTELDLLHDALEKNGWNKSNRFFDDLNHSETINKSRSSKGYQSWNLVTVQNQHSTLLIPDGVKENLPSDIRYIELRGVQVGSSLTAVIAMFSLEENVSENLNKEWHSRHEPKLLPGKKWPHPFNRQEMAIRNIQDERKKFKLW